MTTSLIVATAINGVIGHDNKLPWHCPADLKRFRERTWGHTIIMGRKTYLSIGKPLPGRTSIVVSRNPSFQAEGCHVVPSLSMAMELATSMDRQPFLIGGAEIYRQALELDLVQRVFLSEINETPEGDAFFPPLHPDRYQLLEKTACINDDRLVFKVFGRRRNQTLSEENLPQAPVPTRR